MSPPVQCPHFSTAITTILLCPLFNVEPCVLLLDPCIVQTLWVVPSGVCGAGYGVCHNIHVASYPITKAVYMYMCSTAQIHVARGGMRDFNLVFSNYDVGW